MQRITGLPDEQVLIYEAQAEAALRAALADVMDKIARRIEASAPVLASALVLVAADGAEDQGDEVLPSSVPGGDGLPPGQPYVSPDDLTSIPPLWQQAVADQILPIVGQVFLDAALRTHANMIDASSIAGLPSAGSLAAEQYLARARNTFEQIGDTLWAQARSELTAGFEAGESIPQLAERLRQSASVTARTGVLVARTQVNEASNAGSFETARASGLQMQKEWIATPDLRTRPTHLAADGQRVDLNEPFIVGGFSAMFPASYTLPPAERYSCRCTIGYVMPDRAPAQVRADDLATQQLEDLPGTTSPIDDLAATQSARLQAIIDEQHAQVEGVIEDVHRRFGERFGPPEDVLGIQGLSADVAVRQVQVENRIRAAYQEVRAAHAGQPLGRGLLSEGDSEWVSLADIRDRIGDDISRVDLDAALRRFGRGGNDFGTSLTPESNQAALTQRVRDAAIRLGGQEQHHITFVDASLRPLPPSTPLAREAGPGIDLPARGENPPGYIRPSLRDAKTPRQLRRVWQDEVESITGYPFVVDAMPRGISMVTAREYAEGTLQMFAQFPAAKVDRIHWFDDAASSSYAQVRRGGHALEFNMRYASEAGRPKFLAARRRDVAGWDDPALSTSWGVRNDLGGQGVVYHEFTHILDIENGREVIHGQIVPLLIRHAQDEGITDIDDLIKRRISSYATKNYQEMVAEAGTDVMVNGAAASQLSRDIFDLVRAEYRRRGFEIRTAPALPEDLGDVFPKVAGLESVDEAVARMVQIPAAAPKALRASVETELRRQLELVPGIAGEIRTIRVATPAEWRALSAKGLTEDRTFGIFLMPDRDIVLDPKWRTARTTIERSMKHSHTEDHLAWSFPDFDVATADYAAGMLRHEFGHAVSRRWPGAEMRTAEGLPVGGEWTEAQKTRLLHPLAEELHVRPPRVGENPTDWWAIGEVQRAARSRISGYAEKNLQEAMAEIWAVYSGRGADATKLAQRIGKIMRDEWTGAPEIIAPAVVRAAPRALSTQTVAQLRALAKERGIAIPAGTRKADLVRMLEESPPTPAAIRLAEARSDLAAITSPVRRATAESVRRFDQLTEAAKTGDSALRSVPIGLRGAGHELGGKVLPDLPVDAEDALRRVRMRDGFKAYIGHAYEDINLTLREGVAALRKRVTGQVEGRAAVTADEAISAIRGIDEAMDLSRTADDVIVYRASKTGRSIFGDPATWGDDLSGFEWMDPGYASSSAVARQADYFLGDAGVRMRIVVPKGSSAVQISGSEFESEMLLGRGAKFRVVRDNGWKTITHPETGRKVRYRDLDVQVDVPDVPPSIAGEPTGRAALRAAARSQAAIIATQRGNAALIARIDELVQAKASKAVIRQELDPALREAEQLYAGADKAVADALRTAVDSGDAAKIRAALTRQSKASGLTPIGKAGAKAKFDPATMEGVGGTVIPDGADVIVVRRGARIAGLETPEKAVVRLARPSGLDQVPIRYVSETRSGKLVTSVRGGQMSDADREELRLALQSYASGSFKNIGDTLRGLTEADPDTAKFVARFADDLDAAMKSSKLRQDIELWRGMRTGRGIFGEDVSAVGSGDLIGFEWTDRSFTSFATDEAVAKRFARLPTTGRGVTLHVVAPKGTGAVALDAESEILLRRGLRYRVVADRGLIDGTRTLDVEIIPAPKSTAKTVAKGDFTGLTRTSEAMGGNPGGIFEAGDGSRWYVKTAAGEAQAKSEALALDLYRAAGLDAPEMVIGQGVEGLGTRQVATRFLDDAQVDLRARLANDPAYIADVQGGFAVDAWLGNWDVVGANPAAGWDNIVSVAGQPVRIEAGGALRYRGLGGTKPFGDLVTEFDTLRDPQTARRAAQVFESMTPEQLIASAERVRKVTPAKIKALVKKHGLDPELADTLIARRADILRRAEALVGPKPMTVREYNAAIKAAAKRQDALDVVPYSTTDRKFGPNYVPDAVDRYRIESNANDLLRGTYRDPHAGRLDQLHADIHEIDQVFDASRLTGDVELWRGPGSGRSIFGESATWGDDLAGFEWSESAYSSTSASRTVADRFTRDGGVRLRVLAPKGSKAIQLSGMPAPGIGLSYTDEAEILLARGARYRVVRDRGWTEITHPTGHQRIRVRDLDVEVVVPDETPPLPWATK